MSEKKCILLVGTDETSVHETGRCLANAGYDVLKDVMPRKNIDEQVDEHCVPFLVIEWAIDGLCPEDDKSSEWQDESASEESGSFEEEPVGSVNDDEDDKHVDVVILLMPMEQDWSAPNAVTEVECDDAVYPQVELVASNLLFLSDQAEVIVVVHSLENAEPWTSRWKKEHSQIVKVIAVNDLPFITHVVDGLCSPASGGAAN